MEFPLTIAYNMAEKKVGCVLLQPALGATFGLVSSLFDSKTWDLSPSKLKVYTVKSKEEMNQIIAITHKAHGINSFRII